MKTTIITALTLAFSLNVFAATQSSSRSENIKVFVATESLDKTIRQGLIQTIVNKADRSKAVLGVLFEKALAAGQPSHTVTTSIYGGKKQVVRLMSTPSHSIELEADLPLPSSSFKISVISKADFFDAEVAVDNLASSSLNLSGQLAKDFQATLLKIGLTPDSSGVVNLFGANTFYHLSPGSKVDSDVICGTDIITQRAFTCTIYNNIK